MRRDKKGMTMALGVIIAIVVLIVVALAVIAITSGALSGFGRDTTATSAAAGENMIGTSSCASCGFTWTKGTASTLDDEIYALPQFCQSSDATDYCCTGLSYSNCIEKSNCGKADTNDETTGISWATCTPA